MNQNREWVEANRLLQSAYRRGRQYPPEQRQWLLKICLVYVCQSISAEQTMALLHGLSSEYGSNLEGNQVTQIPAQDDAGFRSETMQRMLTSYYGDQLPKDLDADSLWENMLKELDERLCQICQVKKSNWRSTLKSAAVNQSRSEEAMQYAANESFERLLNALNPEGGEKHLERSKWKITALYKAELYKVIADKFVQLKAYHDKGRLVRDFRSLYKMYYTRGGNKTESS